MESVQLSIITPVFNGAALIESCIQNVITQQCPSAEHVIVDGGSTDGTVEIIARYASQYPHIRWVSEKDRGQSDAMNKGIRMAIAPVISFLNVDDYYEPNALNRVAQLVPAVPEPSLLIGNCNIWRSDTELIRVSKPHHLNILDLLLRHGEFPQNPASYFYHKSLHHRIGFYNVDEHFNLDVEFIFDAVQHAHVFRYDEVWGNYRMLPGTKTKDLVTSGKYWENYGKFVRRYVRRLPWSVRVQYNLAKSFRQVQKQGKRLAAKVRHKLTISSVSNA